ncbi:MAG TPA: hypothetical protein VNW29_01680 [Candidatus Sulfotelmatobacter sp.]|jgi:hypothetical protein|nr:hypothetical protein [Candidatus Sulfotelmatobacter sp.]
MKIIVTHMSPDWDAITSVWLLRKYLSGWQEATIHFVPAGQRFKDIELAIINKEKNDPIEKIGENEVIQVDTGLGPLDHHQIQDSSVSAASLTWDYVLSKLKEANDKMVPEHKEAISRIVKIVVDIDHFREVFWHDAASDIYEFSLLGVLEGLKYQKQNSDNEYMEFGIACLNALVAEFENRIWAEQEIKEKGVEFETSIGKGIGFETLNDTVLKLSQKMGYRLVVRKDPRKGYVRIKTLPDDKDKSGIDLTLVYEKLKKMDPDATWFLHVSKKMLLNGTPKNPKMVPTKLSLHKIIDVLKNA